MEQNTLLRACISVVCMSASLTAQTTRKVGSLDYHPTQSNTASKTERPPSFALTRGAVAPKRLGALNPEETALLRTKSQNRIIGVQRNVPAELAHQGTWVETGNGSSVYQVAFASDGAAGLRVHFSNFAVGAGRVWTYSADRAEVHGPYTGAGIGPAGDFWSNTIHADSVVVEYAPDGASRTVPFDISSIGHAVADDQGVTTTTNTCELDISCYTDWSSTANGVGMISFVLNGQMNQCSGALVNDAKNDFTPYFLTAGHCIPDAATAQSVEVVWQYQTGSCNGAQPDPSTLPASLGATYLVSAMPDINTGAGSSDFSLIRLSSLPNMNLVFYGWNPDPAAVSVGDNLTAIHHPRGEVKKIAFGVRAPDVRDPAWPGVVQNYSVTSFYEISFTGSAAGRIEPGSSGSPLIAQDRTIVGTASAVPYPSIQDGQACSYDPFVVQYSRMSNAYSLLAPYLGVPAVTSISTAVQLPSTPISSTLNGAIITTSPTSLSWYWAEANPSQTAPAIITLSTTSSVPVTVAIGANQPWITLSDQAMTISQGNPGLLRASLDPSALLSGGNLAGSITVAAGGVQAAIPVNLTAEVVGLQPSLTANLSVFPLFESGPGYTSVFTLTNPYPSSTTGFLTFVNLDGSPLLVQTVPIVDPTLTTVTQTSSGLVYNYPAPAQAFPAPIAQANLSANQNTTITTAPMAPLRQGMALAWTADTQKALRATLAVNGRNIPAAVPVGLPFSLPFDATLPGSTQLFVYNSAWWGAANLTITGYDSAGSLIGTANLSVPVEQGGSLVLSPATAVFGGKKGTLVVSGSGTVVAMGLQIIASGGITPVIPSPSGH